MASKISEFWHGGFNEKTFLWTRLTEGVSHHNLATFYYAVFMSKSPLPRHYSCLLLLLLPQRERCAEPFL